jgi:hypothetical protein
LAFALACGLMATAFAQGKAEQPSATVVMPISSFKPYVPWIVPLAPNDGVKDAFPILQAAVEEAETKNETIAPLPGIYYLSSPLQITAPINILGCGVHCSLFVTKANQQIMEFQTVWPMPAAMAGTISELGLDCNWQGQDIAESPSAREGTGISLTDTLGMTFRDLAISNCAQDFSFGVNTGFDERNIIDHVTLYNFTTGFQFNGPFNFGHIWFTNIEYNTSEDGDALFRLSPENTTLYNVTVTANGNMMGNSCVFDLSGGEGVILDNDIRVMAENDGTGTPVGFCGAPNGSPKSAVNSHGFVTISGGTLQTGNFGTFNLVP